ASRSDPRSRRSSTRSFSTSTPAAGPRSISPRRSPPPSSRRGSRASEFARRRIAPRASPISISPIGGTRASRGGTGRFSDSRLWAPEPPLRVLLQAQERLSTQHPQAEPEKDPPEDIRRPMIPDVDPGEANQGRHDGGRNRRRRKHGRDDRYRRGEVDGVDRREGVGAAHDEERVRGGENDGRTT